MVRLRRGQREALERRVYDLRSDSAEATPGRWFREGPVTKQLLGLCRSDPDPGGLPAIYARGAMLSAPKVGRRAWADARALEKLRALGYVE